MPPSPPSMPPPPDVAGGGGAAGLQKVCQHEQANSDTDLVWVSHLDTSATSHAGNVMHLHALLAVVEMLGYWLDAEVEATWALAPAWNLHNHGQMGCRCSARPPEEGLP